MTLFGEHRYGLGIQGVASSPYMAGSSITNRSDDRRDSYRLFSDAGR